jgi:hypothetical protein
MTGQSRGPLAGVRVIDLASILSGPVCAARLAAPRRSCCGRSALDRCSTRRPRVGSSRFRSSACRAAPCLLGWAHHAQPAIFALPAGIADVLTGLFAVPVALSLASGSRASYRAAIAWNVLGLLDFGYTHSISTAITLHLIEIGLASGGRLSGGVDCGIRRSVVDPAASVVVAPNCCAGAPHYLQVSLILRFA